jgi:hypothetical protein
MKHLRRLLCIFSILGFCIIIVQGQEAIPATGGNATGTGGSVSYTMGQIADNLHSGSNGTIVEGVQQPYEVSVVTAIEDAGGLSLESIVYPNPSSGQIRLIVESPENENLRFRLYDITGVLLLDKRIEGRETEITLENFASSVYLLKLVKNNKEAKVFKIVKR